MVHIFSNVNEYQDNPIISCQVKKGLENHLSPCDYFGSGVRFGEMAALKWHNVDTDRCTARICETLVYSIEGRPKTRKSNRDIDLLPPVLEALESLKQMTYGKSDHEKRQE